MLSVNVICVLWDEREREKVSNDNQTDCKEIKYESIATTNKREYPRERGGRRIANQCQLISSPYSENEEVIQTILAER